MKQNQREFLSTLMWKVEAQSADSRRGKKVLVRFSGPLDAKHERAPSGLCPSWTPISGGHELSPGEGDAEILLREHLSAEC